MLIRDAHSDDAAAIVRIYNPYITDTCITFETEAVTAATMQGRMQDVQQAGLPYFVCEVQGEVVGYAYATPWKARAAYRQSVESSVYLAPDAQGKGVGSALYQALLAKLHHINIHAVIGGIALPNDASIALHERLGFAYVGKFEQVGFKHGRWVDVGYWQRIL